MVGGGFGGRSCGFAQFGGWSCGLWILDSDWLVWWWRGGGDYGGWLRERNRG